MLTSHHSTCTSIFIFLRIDRAKRTQAFVSNQHSRKLKLIHCILLFVYKIEEKKLNEGETHFLRSYKYNTFNLMWTCNGNDQRPLLNLPPLLKCLCPCTCIHKYYEKCQGNEWLSNPVMYTLWLIFKIIDLNKCTSIEFNIEK